MTVGSAILVDVRGTKVIAAKCNGEGHGGVDWHQSTPRLQLLFPQPVPVLSISTLKLNPFEMKRIEQLFFRIFV